MLASDRCEGETARIHIARKRKREQEERNTSERAICRSVCPSVRSCVL